MDCWCGNMQNKWHVRLADMHIDTGECAHHSWQVWLAGVHVGLVDVHMGLMDVHMGWRLGEHAHQSWRFCT